MNGSNNPALSADFTGKVAVVLGASAQGGTGWAIAEAIAARGAKVVVAARSIEPLRGLAEKIGGTAVQCDAANEDQVAALARAAVDTYGRLDIAVNSAGAPTMGMISDSGQDALEQAIRVNYYGHVYFIRHMAEAIGQNGSIVTITSMSVTHTFLPFFSYACAKAAADCLVRYAALEYGDRNIKVNSIQPGLIKSDIAKEALAIPGFEEAYLKEIPLRRASDPADIADAAVWLAGSANVTGMNLNISAGHQLTRFPYIHEMPSGEDSFGSGKALADR